MPRAPFDLELKKRLVAEELAAEGEELLVEAQMIEDPEERGIASEKILRSFKERLREELR